MAKRERSRMLVDAVVVRAVPISESSQVVRLVTAREGSLVCLARGSFRPKSGFGGALDVLTRGVADVTTRGGAALDLLHGFSMTHPHRGLRRSRLHHAAACHVLALLLPFSWPRDRDAALYTALEGVLDALEKGSDPLVLETWLLWFAGRLLLAAGFEPRLDECTLCARPLPRAARVHVAVGRGGALCGSCAGRLGVDAVLSEGAVSILRRALFGARDERPGKARPATPAALREARSFVERCVEYRLERPLPTRRSLEQVLDPAPAPAATPIP